MNVRLKLDSGTQLGACHNGNQIGQQRRCIFDNILLLLPLQQLTIPNVYQTVAGWKQTRDRVAKTDAASRCLDGSLGPRSRLKNGRTLQSRVGVDNGNSERQIKSGSLQKLGRIETRRIQGSWLGAISRCNLPFRPLSNG